MARGRTTTKSKPASKKTTTPATGIKAKITEKVKGKIAEVAGGKKKKGSGKKTDDKKRISAKMKLKRAYDSRARRQIRLGLLGQARRTLRKKATVV